MTAPSKVARATRAGVMPARAHKPRKFPVSDGAPVEVVEDGPSLAGRLASLAALLTIRPTLAIGSYAPKLPWPWGLVDFVSRVVRPTPGTVRATISLPNCTAQLIRAPGVLPADGKRGVIVYFHGGAFLTCGANSHGRLVTALSGYADCPVLVVNYRMIPKHSVGEALDDCYDAYKWLRLKGYEPDQIVLAGDSAGGYLALALAERLQREGLQGEIPAAMVTMSPLFEVDNETRANHPNIRTDAMFPAKAFTALVELVQAAAQRHLVDGKARRGLRAPGPHRARPAAHPDPRVGVRGVGERRPQGRSPPGRRRGARGGPRVAGPDARLPARRTNGPRGHPVAAADR
jgi:acetyl esterase/lipase